MTSVSADPVRLTPLPRLMLGGRWRTEAMRSYRAPVLYWITRGQGRITVSGKPRGFGAHNAVFVPPKAMHCIETTAQVFGTALFFRDPDPVGMPQQHRHLRVREANAQGELSGFVETIQREVELRHQGWDSAVAHYIGLIGLWIDRQSAEEEAQASPSAAERLVQDFTGLIEAQFCTGQSLAEYAEQLDITPTHLNRVCRHINGRSASDLLQDRIMYEARRLLVETPMTIRRVSEILGYHSAAYFTRAFRRRTGCAPSEFRNGQHLTGK